MLWFLLVCLAVLISPLAGASVVSEDPALKGMLKNQREIGVRLCENSGWDVEAHGRAPLQRLNSMYSVWNRVGEGFSTRARSAGALSAAETVDTARLRMGTSPEDGSPVSGPSGRDRGSRPDSLRPPGFFASPTGALLRSVAFPGWGQWSNGKKQKAAFYFAVESYFITKALIWRDRARVSGIDFATFDHARDRRNYFYWFTGITIFISMFDAYADRYLLTLERTRDAGDDYWGGRKDARYRQARTQEWRLSLRVRF